MKKLLLILILITGWQLSSAQERYYVLPEKDTLVVYYKQYKITWYAGIDPVQLKSGEWVLSEKSYKALKTEFIDTKKQVTVAQQVRDNMSKYPIRVIRQDEWKVLEEQLGEKTIPK